MNKKIRWVVAAAAGASLAMGAGCSTMDRASREPTNPANKAETQSEQALDNAHKAQQEALNAQKADEAAQRNLASARKSLTDAEAKASQAHSNAQQLQAKATQETQAATQQAEQSQKQAMSALSTQQKEQGQQAKAFHEARASQSGASTINGELVQANGDQVVLKTADNPHLAMKVANGVTATLDGQPVSFDQLPPGAQVRAAYSMQNGEYQLKELHALSK